MSAGVGLFLRHSMGAVPGDGSPAGSSDSPDIIPVGTSPLADPSTLATEQSYETEPAVTPIVSGETNYLYVRGLSTDPGATEARVWLWYTQSALLLWPEMWMSEGLSVDGEQRNYADMSVAGTAGIAVSEAFALEAPRSSQDQPCWIAIAENAPLSEPPVPPLPGALSTLADFAVWQKSPSVAFRNVVTGAQGSWVRPIPLQGPSAGGRCQLGVRCDNVPVGCRFRFLIPELADSGMNTIDQPNEQFLVEVEFPPACVTDMTLSWWQNGTTYPPGSAIRPSVWSGGGRSDPGAEWLTLCGAVTIELGGAG
jgi:hypothetical protein